VLLGDRYVTQFPVIGAGVIPDGVAMAFTVFALMGMTNAANHSDGLDGLAGGEAILSLVAIAFLAYLADGGLAVVIAVAVIGGVFGFLRYNTHPAVVFMGDSGSQVIGFSLGVLAVLLTQDVDTSLSPAVAVLLLGLPIADILYVFYCRVKEGRNWFLATKNHVHHRLIERRFLHPEAVVIIYGIHILFVGSGLVFRHASDWLLIAIYVGGCVVVFGGLHFAEARGWYAPQRGEERGAWRWIGRGKRKWFTLVELPRRYLELAIPFYLFAGSLLIGEVPRAFGFLAAGLLVLAAARLLIGNGVRTMLRRGVLFGAGALVVFLTFDPNVGAPDRIQWAEYAILGLAAVAVAVGIRYSPQRRREEFRTTGLDYLAALVLLVAIVAIGNGLNDEAMMLCSSFVVLYAMEFMTTERRQHRQWLDPAAWLALAILAIRGLL
jgi:UDP-GlcNAc:undecaprenyl-phosphate GlcNAc-1-phosphate transferase